MQLFLATGSVIEVSNEKVSTFLKSKYLLLNPDFSWENTIISTDLILTQTRPSWARAAWDIL
jgi:hypothetical protein